MLWSIGGNDLIHLEVMRKTKERKERKKREEREREKERKKERYINVF